VYVQGNPINVTAASKKSVLTSTPTIQSITKKAIVKKILNGKEGQLPEDHSKEAIEIFVHIDSDVCSILLNTTGESLHKR
jgi:putative N6-adenine-specific DNA methylase